MTKNAVIVRFQPLPEVSDVVCAAQLLLPGSVESAGDPVVLQALLEMASPKLEACRLEGTCNQRLLSICALSTRLY